MVSSLESNTQILDLIGTLPGNLSNSNRVFVNQTTAHSLLHITVQPVVTANSISLTTTTVQNTEEEQSTVPLARLPRYIHAADIAPSVALTQGAAGTSEIRVVLNVAPAQMYNSSSTSASVHLPAVMQRDPRSMLQLIEVTRRRQLE